MELDVQQIGVMSLEDQGLAYRCDANPRGEVQPLRILDNFVLTEVTVIYGYLDEMATSDTSLYGPTPLERAETRICLRRMGLEIAQPLISWCRKYPAIIDFYSGNLLPIPEARLGLKVGVNQYLNLLDHLLEGKTWLCGDRFSSADVHFYGLVKTMLAAAEWVISPGK
jgi:glutathione S-transferase